MKTNQISRVLYQQKKSVLFFCSIAFLAIVFTTQSCENEEVIESKNTVTTKEVTKNSTLGNLQSTNNEPISNAKIKLGDQILAISGSRGNFALDKKDFEINDVLIIEHDDFVTLYKVIVPNMKLFFLMKERADLIRIGSNDGGVIPVGPGGEISIPSNAFSNNGNPYNGAVDIRATYIDVTDDSELESAPGAYIADDGPGTNPYPLASYGMMEIMATIAGTTTLLDLRQGKEIKTSFPILDEDKPNDVNLYELNRVTGYWSELGELTAVDNTLQGSITSLNNGYNADKPCANRRICVKIKIVYANGGTDCGIGVRGITYRGFDGLKTPDKDGYVRFWVCPNSVFQLRACRSDDPIYNTTFDLSTVIMNPFGCTDLGVWTINN
ncbi:hypothetical protein [Aquimarina sp. 2304DJ70-9]|uniref:hypothetical protein n=1 Tax=Aquimarina penaris TaxID=3231044 RepID=UPI003462CAFD